MTSLPVGFPEMNLRPSEVPARLEAMPARATMRRDSLSGTGLRD